MASPYRVANFSAGPSNLPLEVLLESQKDLLNYDGTGTSVMEMSHRSKAFQNIWDNAMKDIRYLLKIPDNYQVFFLQGGGTTQFSAVALNFNYRNNGNGNGKIIDYIVTGNWSNKAYIEAKKYSKNINLVYSTMNEKPQGTRIPDFNNECKFSENAEYLHICINETVHGVTMRDIPNVKCPIIADFSSCFMSEPIDVSKFALIYAGAQKNIGPAGVTVVIVDSKYVGNADVLTPVYLDYKSHLNNKIYNTPTCWSIYVMGLVFKWLRNLGNDDDRLGAIEKINKEKAKIVYDAIDNSDGFYYCPVVEKDRSLMNIRYNCRDGAEIEKKFIDEAAKQGMINLKGYRTLGGIRASCYNAMTLDNCKKLVKFMNDFRIRNKDFQAKSKL